MGVRGLCGFLHIFLIFFGYRLRISVDWLDGSYQNLNNIDCLGLVKSDVAILLL